MPAESWTQPFICGDHGATHQKRIQASLITKSGPAFDSLNQESWGGLWALRPSNSSVAVLTWRRLKSPSPPWDSHITQMPSMGSFLADPHLQLLSICQEHTSLWPVAQGKGDFKNVPELYLRCSWPPQTSRNNKSNPGFSAGSRQENFPRNFPPRTHFFNVLFIHMLWGISTFQRHSQRIGFYEFLINNFLMFILYVYVCVWVLACGEVRGQHIGAVSLLLPHGFRLSGNHLYWLTCHASSHLSLSGT